MKRITNFTRLVVASDLFVPGMALLFYVSFAIIAKGTLPTAQDLITLFQQVYKQYGYEIIFVSAFLESLVVINFLVPGSLALAMGAVFAKSGELDLTQIVLVASLASNLGFFVDYFLGALGFDKLIIKMGYGQWLTSIEKKVNKKTLAFAFINPNLGSFFALSAGIIKMPLATLFSISIIATLFWFSLWGILFYITGNIVLEIFSKYFALVFLIMAGAAFLIQVVGKKEKK